MSYLERGAELVPLLETYMSLNTVSLNRRTDKPVKTRVVNISDLGTDFDLRYYGDELKWDVIELARLKFGDSKTVKYDKLSQGWIYRYDMVNRIFSVIDGNGSVIEVSRTSKISEFGITWKILESHQFYLYYGINQGSWSWHISAKATKRRNDELKNEFEKTHVDEFGYGDANIHFLFDVKLIHFYAFTEILENEIYQCIDDVIKLPTIVRSNYYYKKGNVKGDYTDRLVDKIDGVFFTTPTKVRDAIVYRMYEILMSAIWLTINNRNNPVIEPWMLWEMWKWLGAGLPSIDEERIFDLSPNWSY